jgi:hypothetical protein
MRRLIASCLWILGVLSFVCSAAPRGVTWDDLIPPAALKKLEAWEKGDMKDDSLLRDPEITDGIVQDLNGKLVRIAGFIVPLEGDDARSVTAFFFVPYYGACIHTPPPPPNQIVYVTVDKAFRLESMWEPFWIEGAMRTEQVKTGLGLAGYTMKATKIEEYKE